MAVWKPEVLGVGYDLVEQVLGGNLVLSSIMVLAILKIVATSVCYSSGNAGGIFGPSLFIGAMIGGSVGAVAHTVFPEQTAGPGAYALIGMGTAFAGIVRSPQTSVIMVFEMTRDYSIIVPLMISNLVSFFVSQRLQHEPIYEALARQEGVLLPTAEGREVPANLRVGNALSKVREVLLPTDAIPAALRTMQVHGWDALPVNDGDGIRALATERELRRALEAGQQTVGDIYPSSTSYAYVHVDHSLSVALQTMGAAEVNVLPVVSRSDIRHVIGMIALPDILSRFGVRERMQIK
jgi:CIC family chloride channel protein